MVTRDIIRERFEESVGEGRIGDRLWLYPTYHCNLACVYCLTESSPRIADRRTLPAETLLRAAREAKELGFRSIGITGGEVFMLPWFPEILVELSRVLPTITLTNAMLFTGRVLDRLEPLAELDAALQLSLDTADPGHNDRLRGRRNFATVLEAIPRLRERGLTVRIATTVEDQTEDELTELCGLHRSLGISDEDHIVRPVVRRGRADVEGLGVDPEPGQILSELTLTADGAFLNPFGPTVRHGRTDLDLLVSRQILPLSTALTRFLRVAADLPAGDDVARNIR
jgi:MoaA/NifB/PqqE/SkfB family radical SAM enzyme